MSDLLDEDIPYERLSDPEAAPENLGSLVDGLFDGRSRARLAEARLASRAWNEANGDRERSHTTGVTLVPARPPATDPRMVVYVDSNVLLADFRTNTDLYLGRLSNWGLALSGLDFRLSHDTGRHWRATSDRACAPAELTPEQESWLDALVADLPEDDDLRSKARSAVESSLRHNRAA